MLKFNWKKLGFSTSEKEFSNATRLAVVARFKLEKAKKQSDKQLIASLEKEVQDLRKQLDNQFQLVAVVKKSMIKLTICLGQFLI